jgi:assimilatory nitrate reductase catalytic subunit
MTLTVADGGGQPRVLVTPRDFPTNRGGLCQKGWTSAALLAAPDRLTTPLIKDGPDSHRPAGWDEALDLIVGRITALQAAHGPDAVAVFGSGALTNEKAYLLGKFARVALRTSQIDYNGRFCMSSAAAAGNRAFGLDRGLPFPVTDLDGADVIVLAGANPAETMPPLMSHLTASRAASLGPAGVGPARGGSARGGSARGGSARGGSASAEPAAERPAGIAAERTKLLVIDPRRTPTAEAALRHGGIHLQPAPGTDLALALGLLHVAWVEGYLDTPARRAYRLARTTGWDEVQATVAHWWPERVERITGVPAADLRRAAHLLHTARRAYILTGRGAEQHSKGTDTVTAWINLALAFGLPGTPGSGYGCLTGQGNGQGGREHGQKADQLPGYRSITDKHDREHVAAVWGVPEHAIPGPGRSASELIEALGDLDEAGNATGPRALLVFGANLAVSAPRAGRVRDKLAALDLLVVADSVPSETARLADVILPVTQWAEETGTMTSLEGRVLRRRRAIDPPPGVRTDLEVIAALATRLGRLPAEFPADPDLVLAELGAASRGSRADYSGVTPERLDAGHPVYWPAPLATSPAAPGPAGTALAGPDMDRGAGIGTPRLFADRFAHPDGKARFISVIHRDADELPDVDYPLYATTGRVLQHYQSGAQTRRVPELLAAQPEAFIEVHPDTARQAGLADGALAYVRSRRGTVTARVRCISSMRTDTVFLPFHFPGDGAANELTNPALDPVSRMPEFKVCAVRIEPAGQQRPAQRPGSRRDEPDPRLGSVRPPAPGRPAAPEGPAS